MLRPFAAGGDMAQVRRLSGIAIAVVALLVAIGPTASFAKDKPKPPASKAAPPPGETINACGCYHDATGGCVCTDKKGKCECAGECEPVGCEQKRQKELDREMAAEIKRAQEDEKRRKDAQEAQENGTENGTAPDAGAAPPADAPAPKTKAPRKVTGAGKTEGAKADKK